MAARDTDFIAASMAQVGAGQRVPLPAVPLSPLSKPPAVPDTEDDHTQQPKTTVERQRGPSHHRFPKRRVKSPRKLQDFLP